MKSVRDGRGRCRRGGKSGAGGMERVCAELSWRKRGAGGGEGCMEGGVLRVRLFMAGRGTRGCGKVCEGVGVEEVVVGRVERDYIVCGGEGVEGLREWIQLGRVLGDGGGGRGGRAVDGDKVSLSGVGVGPGPAGCRGVEEGRNEKRLE